MGMMEMTNIVLIVLCIFSMLLVWSRNRKRKRLYLERIKGNPEYVRWVISHTGANMRQDIETVRQRFGLPTYEALQLLEFCKKQQTPK